MIINVRCDRIFISRLCLFLFVYLRRVGDLFSFWRTLQVLASLRFKLLRLASLRLVSTLRLVDFDVFVDLS